jgi:hypothetical protein
MGQADTKVRDAAGSESGLPMGEHHLLRDEHGGVPVDLNECERQVLNKGMDNPGFVAWFQTATSIPSRSSDRAMPAPMAPVPRTVTRMTVILPPTSSGFDPATWGL